LAEFPAWFFTAGPADTNQTPASIATNPSNNLDNTLITVRMVAVNFLWDW
jgi:hypothetical protein